MLKSTRLTALIAALLVFLLTCAQVSFIQARVTKTAFSSSGPSANEQTVNKKAKKKRRKKKTVFHPYLGMQSTNVSPTIGHPRLLTSSGSDQKPPVLQPRSANRISRTPGLHITPIVPSKKTVPFVSLTNPTPITIFETNADNDPFPAEPYPSDIDVADLEGVVTSVSVTINGLTHPNPDDLDMLLVSPDDRTFHFWSDVGGGALLPPGQSPTEITVTVSDSGGEPLPDEGPLVSGTTYQPFNASTSGDFFPGVAGPYAEPAPAGKATFASVFNGMTDLQANGTWRLFVTDDQNELGGTIARGWTINITTQAPVTTAGQVVISEFRTSGPLGPTDEYVELYNTTGAPLVVHATDDSDGLGVFASDGLLRCVVPNGTRIPTNGHFLCANEPQTGTAFKNRVTRAASIDQALIADIPTNAGIAIFNTSYARLSDQVPENRIDAVGPTTVDPLYREGTGYTALDQPSLDHAFYRDLRPNGQPKDTNNNSDDFLFVDTSGAATTSGQRLGAPSPEGMGDVRTSNDIVVASLPAPCLAATAAPNRVRTVTPPQTNATFGTLSIRRAISNTTENEINALRFKVIAITSYPVLGQATADVRLLSSSGSDEEDPCNSGSTFSFMGLTLDGPVQPKGGAFNSNVSADILSLGQPLQPGQTIYVNFLLGVEQTGRFHFFVNIETLP